MAVWFYWLLGTSFYFYQFIFRTIFSTLGDEVGAGFALSASDLALFFASGMLSYSLMQVPAGLLLDRFGPRKIMTVAMSALGIGILCISLTSYFPLAIVGRIIMGIGSAFGFLSVSKIAVMWFPERTMGFLLGATVFVGALGGAFSYEFYNALPEQWDWRVTLTWMSVLGFALAVTFAVFLRERPASRDQKPEARSVVATFKEIFSNRHILVASAFLFFAYIPISILGDSWGPLAFEKMFDVDKEVANKTVPFFYIAFAVGALIYAGAAALLKQARMVLIVGFGLVFVVLLVLLTSSELGETTLFDIPDFLLLTSLLAFNCGGVSLAFPLGCAHAPREIAATVVGSMNMLCMVSGSIFSRLVGHLLEWHGSEQTTADGIPIFSATAYRSALQPLLATAFIALLLLFFIKDKAGEPKHDL